jgi:hypothetical protein
MLPPAPSPRMNGLELALQRAWVDAAARRAKRDSLGAHDRSMRVRDDRSNAGMHRLHASGPLTMCPHMLGRIIDFLQAAEPPASPLLPNS